MDDTEEGRERESERGELEGEEEDIVLQEYHSEDEGKIEKELVALPVCVCVCVCVCVMEFVRLLISCSSDTEEEVEEEYVRKVNTYTYVLFKLHMKSIPDSPQMSVYTHTYFLQAT